jgi:hypothetical protein
MSSTLPCPCPDLSSPLSVTLLMLWQVSWLSPLHQLFPNLQLLTLSRMPTWSARPYAPSPCHPGPPAGCLSALWTAAVWTAKITVKCWTESSERRKKLLLNGLFIYHRLKHWVQCLHVSHKIIGLTTSKTAMFTRKRSNSRVNNPCVSS